MGEQDVPSAGSSSMPLDKSRGLTGLSVAQLSQAFAQLLETNDPQVAPSLESPSVSGDCDATDPQRPDVAPIGNIRLDASRDEDEGTVTPKSILEAILFVGHPENQPLTSRVIASHLRGVSPQEVDALIGELNIDYQAQAAPYRIVADDAGYRMELHADHNRLRDTFYGKVREARLSQAAIDLLAIVAYHQPITREGVEKFRGQASGALLSQLVRRQLLQLEFTSDKPRKRLFKTTDRFLMLFGLESLDDLPQQDELS